MDVRCITYSIKKKTNKGSQMGQTKKNKESAKTSKKP
jgi:hypothetical protein